MVDWSLFFFFLNFPTSVSFFLQYRYLAIFSVKDQQPNDAFQLPLFGSFIVLGRTFFTGWCTVQSDVCAYCQIPMQVIFVSVLTRITIFMLTAPKKPKTKKAHCYDYYHFLSLTWVWIHLRKIRYNFWIRNSKSKFTIFTFLLYHSTHQYKRKETLFVPCIINIFNL